MLLRAPILAALVLLGLAAPAHAGSWFPHDPGAEWTWEWSDTVFSPTPTREKVTVREAEGPAFTLEWTTFDQGNPPGAVTGLGRIGFQETAAGLVNTDWQSTLPPPGFPVLCPAVADCNNSLASTLFNLVWGGRVPVLALPLLRGTSWNAVGGANGDVRSSSDYLGVEAISVPAFPGPVPAAKVRSRVTQAGALGDPYGSGTRTVWWVYGVGPAKIVFEHAGDDAPVTTAVLAATNQVPVAPPADVNYFPLRKGLRLRYSWRNSKHLRTPSVQVFAIDQVLNGSARFAVTTRSGPLRLAGAYGLSFRGDGLRSLWVQMRAASKVRFPPIGPSRRPAAKRRLLLTPFDLMIHGLNPVIPAHPVRGARWAAKASGPDYAVYGVRGTTAVVGTPTVVVPAGRFRTIAVRSTLTQPGFPFGSGTRTSYFAPGKGLVKLVFRHRDGSVSTVRLLR